MIITFAGFKGGISKTTSAIHLAGFFWNKGSTLLIDADPNQSAMGWQNRGSGLPFTLLNEEEGLTQIRNFEFVVLDTEARPHKEDLEELSAASDLLILPTPPDALALDALMKTLDQVKSKYRILLTMVPPPPSRAADEVDQELKKANFATFSSRIRRFAAFQKAAAAGVLVVDIKDLKAKEAWLDVQNFGKEVLKYGKI